MMSSDLVSLKPLDVVIALKIVTLGREPWTISDIASSLRISKASASMALHRLEHCNLYKVKRRVVIVEALKDFLIYGIRCVYPAQRGGIVRGFPTSIAALPMSTHMDVAALSWPPVWKSIKGSKQGYEIVPLFQNVEFIIADKPLYEFLALVDVLREGPPRERKIAIDELESRFNQYKSATK